MQQLHFVFFFFFFFLACISIPQFRKETNHAGWVGVCVPHGLRGGALQTFKAESHSQKTSWTPSALQTRQCETNIPWAINQPSFASPQCCAGLRKTAWYWGWLAIFIGGVDGLLSAWLKLVKQQRPSVDLSFVQPGGFWQKTWFLEIVF